jgi:predicted cupin superfamily sugar epimerase
MPEISVKSLLQYYNLLPHPEGGYFKESYCSTEMVDALSLPERFPGNRFFSTAIYFLLEKGDYSAFHKIKSDECWHFYAGDTLNVYVIQLNGRLDKIQLGPNISKGETFQYVVPANCWFASEPSENTDFSFVGCTVAPGFDFADFELAKAEELIDLFPQYSSLIKRLCRK